MSFILLEHTAELGLMGLTLMNTHRRMRTAAWWIPILLVFLLVAVCGCSRTEHRFRADREAYDAIAERNTDPRWHADDYSIEIDPRSRYFDPCDPDRPPMPQDDPASHEYMLRVDGRKGWEHWDDNGLQVELENPAWREAIPDYVDVNADGSVRLDIDSAIRLAYIHSPTHQSQLETLYLSALDVTAERFRFDTQYFGGSAVAYAHSGPSESDHLTVDTDLQARRRLATAGELLVGFANSFVVEFGRGGTTFTSSLANFSFVQPLLRGAGRDVALEQLTLVERALLANLRAYQQYRQGFFTQVTIGELGVAGPQRGGAGTVITGFSGQGFVGGYIGLLQQLQQIRNTEDNLNLQERTLARLAAFQDIGVIDLVQVDQFRQSIENERANLLQIRNSFELALDRYKTGTLGLPPDLPIELDDSLIRQFQLVSREATAVEDAIVALQDRVGKLPEDTTVELMRQILADASKLVQSVQRELDEVSPDLARMDEAVGVRERAMTSEEKDAFQSDRERLHKGWSDLKRQFEQVQAELDNIRNGLSEDTKSVAFTQTVVWLTDILRVVQSSILIQARARLETVNIETIALGSREAFTVALANRLDFMNGRAALVDSWRSIQLNADALQSVLNVTANGEIQTARNNPVSFRDSTGNLRLGVEFDAPFTRLVERNNYRQSLIDYQRSRRDFIRSHDSLHLGLRGLLRQIEQLRTDLEIQRRAVTIAIRRVDMTRAAFYAPVRPPQPGQRPAQFGPTAATNLLSALAALRNTQDNFMGVWLNYYAARMRLARELGTMQLDEDGKWMDHSASDANLAIGSESDASNLPPALPDEWLALAERSPQQQDSPAPGASEAPRSSVDDPPGEVHTRPADIVKETAHVD